MRLIDADLLKQNCKCTGKFEDNFICVDLITLAKVIDNQPTVYDVEAVIAELEAFARENDREPNAGFIDMCIEIVRNGGKE